MGPSRSRGGRVCTSCETKEAESEFRHIPLWLNDRTIKNSNSWNDCHSHRQIKAHRAWVKFTMALLNESSDNAEEVLRKYASLRKEKTWSHFFTSCGQVLIVVILVFSTVFEVHLDAPAQVCYRWSSKDTLCDEWSY